VKIYSPNVLKNGVWHNEDVHEAWATLNRKGPALAYDLVHKQCKMAGGNDQYPIAAAAAMCPDFEKLCRMEVQALEAIRAISGFRSEMWSFATAALAWQELPRSSLPKNAPSKLP